MAHIVMAYVVMAYVVMAYIVMAYMVVAYMVTAYIVTAYTVMAYRFMAYRFTGLYKGAKIFNGHSGIWHLHYARLAHYHMPRNTNCDPLGCVGARQCKKPRQSNLFRLR